MYSLMRPGSKITEGRGKGGQRTKRKGCLPTELSFHQSCVRRRWWRALVSVRLVPTAHAY